MRAQEKAAGLRAAVREVVGDRDFYIDTRSLAKLGHIGQKGWRVNFWIRFASKGWIPGLKRISGYLGHRWYCAGPRWYYGKMHRLPFTGTNLMVWFDKSATRRLKKARD